MVYEKYSVTHYSVNAILGLIESNVIAIPEIQRPFVWKPKHVRDFIDSLYNGYPTGYLIIWQNPNVKLKTGGESIGKKILIDGQQRVTSLMTAILGYSVLNDEYEEKVIRIAFNPLAKDEEDRFAVQTPAHINSKHWISDISVVFKSDFDSFGFIEDYCRQNSEITKSELNNSIIRLQSIKNCQIGAIELVPQLNIEEVTEIFVRINSQGKRLNEADFAMSKIAADEKYGGNMLRKAIDYFCHLAVEPGFYKQISMKDNEFMDSEYAQKLKWLKDDKDGIYDPDYSDMLRVSFMHQFGRAKLGDLVSLLSGRNFETKVFEEGIAESSFAKLKTGVLNFMNEYNFANFVLAIRSAGFISEKLGDKSLIRYGLIIIFLGIILLGFPGASNLMAFVGLVIIGFGCAPIYPSIIHATPGNFGEENSQAIIGIQMASAYTGITFMPLLFGFIANHINIGLYPIYLLVFAFLMIIMSERLNKILARR